MGLFTEIKQAAKEGLPTNKELFEKELIAWQHPVVRKNIFGREHEYRSAKAAELANKQTNLQLERGGWLLAAGGSALKVVAICLAVPAAPTFAPLLLLPAFGLGAYFSMKQSQKTHAKLNQAEVNYNHALQQWSNGAHPIQQAAHADPHELAKPLNTLDYLRGAKKVFQHKLGETRAPITPPALGQLKLEQNPEQPNVYVAPTEPSSSPKMG